MYAGSSGEVADKEGGWGGVGGGEGGGSEFLGRHMRNK